MTNEAKEIFLLELLDEFRRWPYEKLATKIEKMQSAELSIVDGVFSDGTVYQVEIHLFWDDKPGGDLRVIGDLTTYHQYDNQGPACTPDVISVFIMRPDGSFVGE